ncbi:cysteine desufuration protein SufE [Kiloniella spongiae]|uniref:Cysteine desufuration protein SufE n=1 Tax=Kiloniella spongiae TaxID=1489064 RepID=A0A0H2M9Q5_9PROT|nr:SufE family protein [Kiloniella spongiae]KLN59264.1 cysteine desufuration protein SufE [Kiloniella spongiae]
MTEMVQDASLDTSIEDLIDSFEFLDDWEERYRYIIEMGRKLTPMDDALKTEASRVQGCTSQVWLVCNVDENMPPRLSFIADSDAHIVRGLVAVLLMIFSNKTAQEIRSIDIDDILARLEFSQHLSPNRANGLHAMVKRIQATAESYC